MNIQTINSCLDFFSNFVDTSKILKTQSSPSPSENLSVFKYAFPHFSTLFCSIQSRISKQHSSNFLCLLSQNLTVSKSFEKSAISFHRQNQIKLMSKIFSKLYKYKCLKAKNRDEKNNRIADKFRKRTLLKAIRTIVKKTREFRFSKGNVSEQSFRGSYSCSRKATSHRKGIFSTNRRSLNELQFQSLRLNNYTTTKYTTNCEETKKSEMLIVDSNLSFTFRGKEKKKNRRRLNNARKKLKINKLKRIIKVWRMEIKIKNKNQE